MILFVDIAERISDPYGEETSNNRNNKILIEAITKLIDTKLNALHEELHPASDQEQNQSRQGRNPRRTREQPEQSINEATDSYYGHRSSSSQKSQRRHNRHAREGRDHPQDNLGGLTLKIPPFHRKNDPDAYLEWKKKMSCKRY